MTLKQSPSQTVGPFFAYCLTPAQYGYDFTAIAGNQLADEHAEGERIRILGRVLDGAGNAVDDAMVEIWQADAKGRYAHPADPRGSNLAFRGFGRYGTGTDPERRFVFDTIKPGPVEGQAPHITVCVMARGMLSHAFTRIYFSDEAGANAADAVLASVPEARRATLIAKRENTQAGIFYHFDVHLQGAGETVFFDL